MGRDLVRVGTWPLFDENCNVINKNENVDDRTEDKVNPRHPLHGLFEISSTTRLKR